jgi:hypothetical protein
MKLPTGSFIYITVKFLLPNLSLNNFSEASSGHFQCHLVAFNTKYLFFRKIYSNYLRQFKFGFEQTFFPADVYIFPLGKTDEILKRA